MEQTIAYINHSAIDKQRWNQLILASHNSLAYAHADMLDAMSPGWDALIAGDYNAVMPLTWRSKLGIKYLCQPAFCQQLGIFSAASIHAPLVEAFVRKASLHFRLIEIWMNFGNPLLEGAKGATNFILHLLPGYESIKNGYKNDLHKNLARTEKFDLIYTSTNNVDLAIENYQMLYGANMSYRKQDYESLSFLCKKWLPLGKCFVREVHLHSKAEKSAIDSLLAIGLFLKDEHRIYNIASTTLPNGRTMEANHFLFDQLIREFAGQDVILDFEGSDLPGVARFYQKFGPQNQPFSFWKSNRLPAVMRWWKK